ncbi:diguanylate cyclase [Vibrio rotiferianus]|uniref:diguanylate cyclase n=1 Tax=Vibrio rotiferianus TaxID=190895 RepID=UPI00339B9875
MGVYRFSFKSVRSKFVVTYSLMTIFFVLILFIVLYFKERGRVFDVALENSTQISNLHSDVISQELQRHVASLQAIVGHERVQKVDIPFIIKELQWLHNISNHSVINTLFADQNWNLVDYKGRMSRENRSSIVDDELWQLASYHITAPHIGRIMGEPLVALGVPVFDEYDDWKGVVAVSISVKYLTERLSKVKLGNSSYAWISDRNGLVVSHPDSSLVMKANIFDADTIGFRGFNAIAEQTKLRAVGYGYYFDQRAKQSKIVTFAKIDSLPGWTLFVTTRESDIFLDINELLEDVVITSSVVIAVFMPVIFYFTNSITKPIIELTKEVEDSASSHYASFVGQSSQDEIGQLSDAFQTTIHQIQQHNRNLEELVSVRTAELNSVNKELEESVSLLNEKNRELTWLAMFDPLTNLFNRRAAISHAEREIARVLRHKLTLSLIILDIDHFKTVNDTYGHDIGDLVLVRLASFLKSKSRKENIIARWGGEEFVIVVVEAQLEEAKFAASNLLKQLKDVDFSPVSKVTVSAGVATYRKEESFSDLVMRADKALYHAKRSGRNCVKTERDAL